MQTIRTVIRIIMNMDFMDGNIINLISNVGFPIVMVITMIKYIQNLNQRHRDEIDSLKDTLHENTNVLVELSTLIKLMISNEKKNTL